MTTANVPTETETRSFCLRPGARFFSRGLGCVCRVLCIGEHGLRFTTESSEHAPMTTEVPLDVAALHVATGRWRLVEAR